MFERHHEKMLLTPSEPNGQGSLVVWEEQFEAIPIRAVRSRILESPRDPRDASSIVHIADSFAGAGPPCTPSLSPQKKHATELRVERKRRAQPNLSEDLLFMALVEHLSLSSTLPLLRTSRNSLPWTDRSLNLKHRWQQP
jgi:hypothetical protein